MVWGDWKGGGGEGEGGRRKDLDLVHIWWRKVWQRSSAFLLIPHRPIAGHLISDPDAFAIMDHA